MTARLIDPAFRALDGNGDPISAACLYVYVAGTSTPTNTYSDTLMQSANANPVESGATGLFPDMFVPAGSYKAIYTDGSGNSVLTDVTLDTWDNIEITSSPTLSLTEIVNAQTGTSYTIQTDDRSRLVTLSNSSPIAITLPQADTDNFPSGWYTTISNKGLGAATITPATSTIDGLATYTMRTGEMIRISSDGTNYQLSMVGGKNPSLNAQTGTSYTIASGDRDRLTTFSNASAVTVVLPQANTTTFKSGWKTVVSNKGAGVVTITPTTSTINGATTLILGCGESAVITSDGTNYQVSNRGSNFSAGKVVTVTSTSNAVTIDLSLADPLDPVFYHLFTENTTFTFSNPKPTGYSQGFTLHLLNDGTGRTPTWPASVKWSPSGFVPTLNTASKRNVLVFVTRDGGTTWDAGVALSETA